MKKHNILLIDDDEVNTFYVLHKLSGLETVGEIFVSVNGQGGLDQIKRLINESVTIDIILLDINMPIMNGFEFLDVYQELFEPIIPDTKVYLVTSSSHIKDSEKAMKYDCIADYIDKSVIIEEATKILNLQ